MFQIIFVTVCLAGGTNYSKQPQIGVNWHMFSKISYFASGRGTVVQVRLSKRL